MDEWIWMDLYGAIWSMWIPYKNAQSAPKVPLGAQALCREVPQILRRCAGGLIGGRVMPQLLCTTPELTSVPQINVWGYWGKPERRAELLEQIARFCMGLQIVPYKSIKWHSSMNHQPYNAFIKNPARQVVDIGKANPTLSKFLKLSHFLMPKHVPNVVAIRSRLRHTNSFIHEPPALQRIYQKSGLDKL